MIRHPLDLIARAHERITRAEDAERAGNGDLAAHHLDWAEVYLTAAQVTDAALTAHPDTPTGPPPQGTVTALRPRPPARRPVGVELYPPEDPWPGRHGHHS